MGVVPGQVGCGGREGVRTLPTLGAANIGCEDMAGSAGPVGMMGAVDVGTMGAEGMMGACGSVML